ncbi:MAG: ankyrin repeat domain-containing protein [Candidatus Dependentiae bacterium]|nr:ankyrin repeat domain-containing protein [Candidatus Dependentiae bacterium]
MCDLRKIFLIGLFNIVSGAFAGQGGSCEILPLDKYNPDVADGVSRLLMKAIVASDYGQVVRALDFHADVNASAEEGITPLMLACSKDNSDIVKFLICCRADSNIQDLSGETALHVAACYSAYGCIKLLLESGARVDVKNNKGQTPVDFAMVSGNYKCMGVLVRKLFEPTKRTVTPKHFIFAPILPKAVHGALMFSNKEMIKDFLNGPAMHCGDNVEAVDVSTGSCLLSLAAAYSSEEIVQMILSRRPHLNRKNRLGQTALHRAVSHAQPNIVELLLIAGASANIVDNADRTAFDIVCVGSDFKHAELRKHYLEKKTLLVDHMKRNMAIELYKHTPIANYDTREQITKLIMDYHTISEPRPHQ